MYMKTRHECIGQPDDTTCSVEKVKIHHVDFAAAPLRNEYIIDTHPYDSKTRAYYHKDKNHKDYKKVVHMKPKDTNPSLHGDTWYMDQIECAEADCPYYIRAAGDRTRGDFRFFVLYLMKLRLETATRKQRRT